MDRVRALPERVGRYTAVGVVMNGLAFMGWTLGFDLYRLSCMDILYVRLPAQTNPANVAPRSPSQDSSTAKTGELARARPV